MKRNKSIKKISMRVTKDIKAKISTKILLLFLIIALPVGLFAVNINTERRQRANVENLNIGADDIVPNNSDNTMGSVDDSGDFAQTLPIEQQGSLHLILIDPPNGNAYGQKKHDADVSPTVTNVPTTSPTAKQDQDKDHHSNSGGPQTVLSLIINISKVEVHYAYLGVPGDVSPREQSVDHWETLKLTGQTTIDLVQLAKSGNPADLGVTKLGAGRYNEVRIYLSSASATLEDGTKVPLTFRGRDNIIRLVQSFTILPKTNTNLTIDFDAQHSVIKAGDSYVLKPVIAHFSETKDTDLSPSPAPSPICIPRPPCLDANPKCELPQPAIGWCPPSNKPLTNEEINSLIIYMNTVLRNVKK